LVDESVVESVVFIFVVFIFLNKML